MVGGAATAAAHPSSDAHVAQATAVKVLLAKLKLRGAHPSPLLFLDALANPALTLGGGREALALGGPSTAQRALRRHVVRGFREALLGKESPWGRSMAARRLVGAALEEGEVALVEGVAGGRCIGWEEGQGGDWDLYGVAVTLCATPEEQAGALLEVACDVNILARQFVGLAPWV
jgi:hypothetical protein